MFYGLHEKIDQTDDNKTDIMRKNLASHFDVSSQNYSYYLIYSIFDINKCINIYFFNFLE